MRRQRIGQELQDRKRRRGFARAALADQRDCFPIGDREVDAAHRGDVAKGHLETGHFEQRFRHALIGSFSIAAYIGPLAVDTSERGCLTPTSKKPSEGALVNRTVSTLVVVALSALFAACSPEQPATQPAPPTEAAAPEPAAEPVPPTDALTTAVDGSWRSADDRSRDVYRHPREALEFWGLAPGMTILEVQPGGAWWTEILAPYAHATGGKYYATAADLDNPELTDAQRAARSDFEARFAANPERYGSITLVNFGPKSVPLPANTFDFVLSARSVHGWIGAGIAEKVFTDLYGALKPGGILALEQHRANEGQQDPKAANGYVAESWVIEQAQKAGFELVAQSEVSANAKDTKDHPFGVWTLPPVQRTAPFSDGPDAHDPRFDRTKYDAIGESDRMTLKFRKPEATASA